jgi:hypothetical protein
MNLLQDPPAGFDQVAKAFAMARHIPATNRLGLQVGLVRNGELFAKGVLDGYRQVAFFSEHVRDHGYREHLLGSEDDMFGCDMIFSHPADHVQSDPSFIRRSPVELWGARG